MDDANGHAPLPAALPAAAAALLLMAGLVLAAAGLDPYLLMVARHPDDPAEALGPVWLRESVRDITALGSNTILTGLALGAAVMLALLGKVRRAAGLIASAAGALAAVNLLKVAFGRERPDLIAELPVLSASFPSSHAMMSASVYLILGLLVAEAAQDGRVRRGAVVAALAIVGLTGLSRVYLGVHWPSDVLVGWALGLAWAIGTMRVFSSMLARGMIEPMR